MADLVRTFLPAAPEITVEVYDFPTFGGAVPFWPGRIVGVQRPDGTYDPAWGPRITLTEGEAFALAGMLCKATGYEIRGLPSVAELDRDGAAVDIDAAAADASSAHHGYGARAVQRFWRGEAA